MGNLVWDALAQKEKAETELRFSELRLSTLEGARAAELAAWHRQWWVVLPLGVLSGFALTVTLQLALSK